jgi:putative DNA primase/helicase
MATISRPFTLVVKPECIPDFLKLFNGWMLWRWEYRPGQAKLWDKPPLQPTGDLASSTDAMTWTSWQEAWKTYRSGSFDGLGFALEAYPGLVGVDLDHCRNIPSGKVAGWAMDVVRRLKSYTEVSPSGTCLRILCYGDLPPHGRRKGNVEVYNSGRYLTITGHHLPDTPPTMERRPNDLLEFHRRVFGDPLPHLPPRPRL